MLRVFQSTAIIIYIYIRHIIIPLWPSRIVYFVGISTFNTKIARQIGKNSLEILENRKSRQLRFDDIPKMA